MELVSVRIKITILEWKATGHGLEEGEKKCYFWAFLCKHFPFPPAGSDWIKFFSPFAKIFTWIWIEALSIDLNVFRWFDFISFLQKRNNINNSRKKWEKLNNKKMKIRRKKCFSYSSPQFNWMGKWKCWSYSSSSTTSKFPSRVFSSSLLDVFLNLPHFLVRYSIEKCSNYVRVVRLNDRKS